MCHFYARISANFCGFWDSRTFWHPCLVVHDDKSHLKPSPPCSLPTKTYRDLILARNLHIFHHICKNFGFLVASRASRHKILIFAFFSVVRIQKSHLNLSKLKNGMKSCHFGAAVVLSSRASEGPGSTPGPVTSFCLK